MKRKLLCAVCVVTLGLSGVSCLGLQEDGSIEKNPAAQASVRQESFDEFDQLVDDAGATDAFKGLPAAAAEPKGIRLWIMRCGVPLIGLYTSAVLKYRACKSWVKVHCVQPVLQKIGSRTQSCGSCHASKSFVQE